MGPLVESVVEAKLLVADGILVAVLALKCAPPAEVLKSWRPAATDAGRCAEEDGAARRRFLRKPAKGAPLEATAKAMDFVWESGG